MTDVDVVEYVERQIVVVEAEGVTELIETREVELVVVEDVELEVVEVLTPGAQGRPGQDGADGQAGADGRAIPFEHEQTNPSDVWNVIHPLGRKPVVVNVYDEQGEQVLCEVRSETTSLTRIFLQPPMSGKAELL